MNLRPEKQVQSVLQGLVEQNPKANGMTFKVWTMGTRLFIEDLTDKQMYECSVTIPMDSTIQKVLNPPAPKPPKESKPKASSVSKSKAPTPAKEIKPSTARARARKQASDELAAEAAANA